jgi:dephospho-CoA kinase
MMTNDRRVARVALTGGIATGKTHVRREFEELGTPTIDADLLARSAVAVGTPALTEVTGCFGRDVLDPSGALDRAKLAKIVFADPSARRTLEGIIHPYVRKAITEWFGSLDAAQHPFAIADIPLLFEVQRERAFDATIVAACDPETQVRRIVDRNRVSEAEARQRIASQLPIETKTQRADYVVRTDGSVSETDRQVSEVFRALTVRFR